MCPALSTKHKPRRIRTPFFCILALLSRAAAVAKEMERIVCCVCLEELDDVAAKDAVLPCCGRASSSNACCSNCMRVICAASGICPVCRAPGLSFDSKSGSAKIREQAECAELKQSAVRKFVLVPLWDGALSILLLLFRPASIAFEQALESVLSRGPV